MFWGREDFLTQGGDRIRSLGMFKYKKGDEF